MKLPLRPAPGIAPLGPERSNFRDVVHLCLLVVPWAFGWWLWWRVGQSTTGDQLLMAVALVVLVAAVSLPVDVVWIIHNVRIFRRKSTPERKVFLPEEMAGPWGTGLTIGVRPPVVDDAEDLVASAVAEVGV